MDDTRRRNRVENPDTAHKKAVEASLRLCKPKCCKTISCSGSRLIHVQISVALVEEMKGG